MLKRFAIVRQVGQMTPLTIPTQWVHTGESTSTGWQVVYYVYKTK